MHTFVFNVQKLQRNQIGLVRHHNRREGTPASQLPKPAWITDKGHHQRMDWNRGRLDEAHQLAKRKDAVEAISIVIQVGDQTLWREMPTPDFPEGKPRSKKPVDLGKLDRGIQEWAKKEFGKENLVSLDLHTDESTPHFHLVVTPIRDGKLQAKHWLNGAGSLASLRKRAHAVISKYVPCEYQPGRPGGQPHAPQKAAGRLPVAEPGLMGKLIGYKRLAEENDQLRAQVRQLEQRVFSRRKLAVKTSMVKNLQQDAQKLVEREKALNGRQGVILAKENALGAEKARLVAVAKDSVYYEQEASSLLVENEKLQNKLAEKDQTIGELKERLAEYEPRRGVRPSGGSYDLE
jgi:hypothetical protein